MRDIGIPIRCFMVFNATFNNISVITWRSVLLVEETGVHGDNPDDDELSYMNTCVFVKKLTTRRVLHL